MKHQAPTDADNTDEAKGGYAIAGAIALGFAAVIQFAFGGLSEDSLARLPAYIKVAYGVGGKLGITVPLALFGIALIGRDLFAKKQSKPDTGSSPAGQAKAVPSWCALKAAQDDDDLEVGEPIPGESIPKSAAETKKIAATHGRFAGGKTSGPTGTSNPEPAEGGGGMVLSSAKYMNRRMD